MRNRWFIYVVIGLCFGILDWYFLDMLASLNQVQYLNGNLPAYVQAFIVILLVSMNYGIWLIPVVPIAFYEMTRSHAIRKAALAAIIIWSTAILSYYTYYAFLLMFVGLPNLDFMLFSNDQAVTYWADWWPPFRRIILDQFIEWIGIALIGGGIVGSMSAYLFKFLSISLKKKILKL